MDLLDNFSNNVLKKTFEITDKQCCQPGFKYFKDGKEIELSEVSKWCIDINDEAELKNEGITKTKSDEKFNYASREYEMLQNDSEITLADQINKKYLTKKNNEYEFYYLDNQGKKDRIELVFNNDGVIIGKNYYLNGEKMDCEVNFNDNAQLSNIDNYNLSCPDSTTIKIKATANHKVEKIERNGKEIRDNRPLKVILNEAKIATSKNQSRDLVKKKNYIFRNINAKTENSKPSYFKYNGIEYMNR